MAPFISETFKLSPAQKGLMLSIPILAGALMRFPLGRHQHLERGTGHGGGPMTLCGLSGSSLVGSMIGEFGALGGGRVPNAMGLSKQYLGTYAWGFIGFAVLALAMLGMLRVIQLRWTRTWAEKSGRARG